MDPLILLREHEIVLCISMKKERKRFLNAPLVNQQINGVKT